MSDLDNIFAESIEPKIITSSNWPVHSESTEKLSEEKKNDSEPKREP